MNRLREERAAGRRGLERAVRPAPWLRTPAAGQDGASATVDDVVVTARRREEQLQGRAGRRLGPQRRARWSSTGAPDITALQQHDPQRHGPGRARLELDPDHLHPRRRPAGSAVGLRARRRPLYRRRLCRPSAGRRARHLRHRAHRGAARPARHAVRPQHHRRRDQIRHQAARADEPSFLAAATSATTTSTTSWSRARSRSATPSRVGGAVATYDHDGYGKNLTTGAGSVQQGRHRLPRQRRMDAQRRPVLPPRLRPGRGRLQPAPRPPRGQLDAPAAVRRRRPASMTPTPASPATQTGRRPTACR